MRLYLNDKEQGLFYGMDEKVQKHCINVASTLMNTPVPLEKDEKNLLIKSAFLHDIGKIKGTFNLNDRVLYVLGMNLMPGLTCRLADNSNKRIMSRFRKAIYFNLHHPSLGAQMAKSLGLHPDLVFMIENHHNRKLLAENRMLRLLSEADELN